MRPTTQGASLVTKQRCVVSALSLDTVLDLVRRSAGGAVDADMPLIEAGIDSLGSVELRTQLQAAVGAGAVLSSTLIFDHPTVRQLVASLRTAENRNLVMSLGSADFEGLAESVGSDRSDDFHTACSSVSDDLSQWDYTDKSSMAKLFDPVSDQLVLLSDGASSERPPLIAVPAGNGHPVGFALLKAATSARIYGVIHGHLSTRSAIYLNLNTLEEVCLQVEHSMCMATL
jgi:hypothetical protein